VLGGCLYVVGTHVSEGSVERYDVASDTWTAAAAMDMPEGRSMFAAVIIKSAGPVEDQDLFDALIVKASIGRD
jgi:hypothetical protein